MVLVAAFLAVRTRERRRREREERERVAVLSAALLATESFAAKRTFAKKKGKTQMWITIVVVVGTVMLALLCALYCQCGDRIYTTGNGPNRRYNNEQEPLIVEGKPIPPP